MNRSQNKFLSCYMLLMAVLAFAMAPFGFAGMLEGRGGEGALPPLWGGGLCVGSGVILLYGYFRDR